MKRKVKLFLALLCLLLLLLKAASNLNAAAHQFCRFDVHNALSTRISGKLLEFTHDNKELQSSICTYDMSDGAVRGIRINQYAVSAVTASVTEILTNTLAEFEKSGFGMPLGSILGFSLFSGRGPEIKIKTVPLGMITCDTESLFISAGINQTHFKLVVKISCAYEALAPFVKEQGELNFTYTLCEAIIVGEVPRLYFS